MDAIVKLDALHKRMESKFKTGQTATEKQARELEEFFNYIIYDKNPVNKTNSFIKGIDSETRKLLAQSPYVSRLRLGTEAKSSSELGVEGEQGFAYLLLQAMGAVDKQVKERLDQNLELYMNQIIMGNVQAATLAKGVGEEVAQKAEAEGRKALHGMRDKYGVYAFRQGKIDINTSLLELNIELSPKAKQLLNLSASVKNYYSAYVHLETVNRKKAFQGIMATIDPNKTGHQTEKLFQYYYESGSGESADKVNQHLMHMVNLYALSGTGQTYLQKVSDMNYKVIEAKLGAKFLIANIRTNREVVVVPVSFIASNIHKDGYQSLFSHSGVTWRDQRNIPVILNLNKYKVIRDQKLTK